ncbi:MAG: hypothetical protein WBO92_03430 [Candidatus Moraniibacteriota bacterium]
MKKSTKVFLIIGLVPVAIGIISIILALLVGVSGCRSGICNSITDAVIVLHWFILLGIYTVPGTLVVAGVYNLIADKLNARNSVANLDKRSESEGVPTRINQTSVRKNAILTVVIMVFGFGSIFLVYAKIQNSRSEAHMKKFRQLESDCALIAEQQTDPTTCSKTSQNSACRAVITMNPYPIGQKTHYVNRAAYESCLKTKQE